VSDEQGTLYTDRHCLTTQAYADSGNLAARTNIYRYQQPRIDLIDWAFEQVAWNGAERVLDIGCGPGSYLQRLGRRPGLRLIGLDLSRGMLTDAIRSWNPALPWPYLAVADAQTLPLPDASCDRALAMHMLYHVPRIERAVHELRRVLRPGGVLLALTNGERHTQELGDLFEAAVSAVAGYPAARPPKWSDRFSLENGAALLRSAFAQVERRDCAGELIIPSAEPIVGYIASTRALGEPTLPAGVTWDLLMAQIERMANTVIAEQGAFRVTTHTGAFICK
jgi:SAM-dependent methyltransferase